MLYRKKQIGKSLYYIVRVYNGYKIKEIYKQSQCATTSKTWDNIEDCLRELANIRVEQYLTDDSKKVIK